jgi:cell wall-associated NlpC family hydrolase
VNRTEIQPGDLLFFTGRASRSGRVGHVAIAVDADPVSGEVTFIHAARTGIQIDRMSAPYYSSRYIGARRVIGQ